MFVLKKLFKLRDLGKDPDEFEKPFMEHLEDLRDVIIKVVITLLIATIGCYTFRVTLLDVLRHPMEEVWTKSQKEKLPDYLSPNLWEEAKKAAHLSSGLTPEQQTHFFAQFENKELRQYAQAAVYYRAALIVEDPAKRKEFIQNFPDIDQKTRDLLLVLDEKKPSAAENAKSSVVNMQSLKPTETFMLSIKLSVFAGVIISFPFLLYFILQFILPGLKTNERKALWPALIIGFGLFLMGVFFCYFLVLPKALDFFFTYSAGMGVENEWRIGDYITFTTQFTLIFGLAFELPVVVMTLVKIGLLSYQTMSNTRSYAVIGIFMVGAIITPTGDALTLGLLAAPMCLLYEICIWLAYFRHKKELAAEALDDADLKDYLSRKQNENAEENQITTAIPIPVPGRIASYSDDEQHEDSYDHHSHHAEDEGDECDDGTVENFSQKNDSENLEPAKPENLEDEDDYNSGLSFEAPPEGDKKKNLPPSTQ